MLPTLATASCVADSRTDDGGNPVTYEPGLTFDQDPNTGWRCDGAGTGTTLMFTLPAGTRLAEVGLINGYAKVDGTSGGARYPEYRRITSVVWTLPDGTRISQQLTDGDTAVQKLRIPLTTLTGPVQLTISNATAPGLPDNRDAVLISEVWFAAGS